MTKEPMLISRSLLGVGAFLVTAAFSGASVAQERYAAIVIDAGTNEVLHDDLADERRYPASLTKMMTLYMLFEALERGEIRLSDRMPVSRFASLQSPSKLGLRRGETIRVEDAIRALVTKSANDVAVVVAEKLGGSEGRFAARMTARAREIGMTSSRFVNASGLPDPRQITTARDMAALSAALLRDFPQYYPYFQTESMSWRSRAHRNHNRLLGRVDGMDGIKTGYTRMSGFNLASSVERDGKRIIAVVMGGETSATRDAQMAHLVESAYETLALRGGASGATLVSMPINRVAVDLNASSDDQLEGEGEVEGSTSAGLAVEQVEADTASYVVPAPSREALLGKAAAPTN